jgi:hypothetical protein
MSSSYFPRLPVAFVDRNTDRVLSLGQALVNVGKAAG